MSKPMSIACRCRGPVVIYLAVGAALLTLASLLDFWVLRHVWHAQPLKYELTALMRAPGNVIPWLIAAVVVWLHEPTARGGAADDGAPIADRRPARRHRRALLIVLCAVLGGVAAEGTKLCVRRLRPNPAVEGYVYRTWTDRPLSTSGLGLPSSHTMVAFAAAAIMARLFPRSAAVWYLLAAACGFQRILSRAHFLSDVVAAAWLSYGIVWLVWVRLGIPPPRRG